MILKLFGGSIGAEGEPEELAVYSAFFFSLLKGIAEQESAGKAKKEADLMSAWMNMTFEELMRKENEEEDHD